MVRRQQACGIPASPDRSTGPWAGVVRRRHRDYVTILKAWARQLGGELSARRREGEERPPLLPLSDWCARRSAPQRATVEAPVGQGAGEHIVVLGLTQRLERLMADLDPAMLIVTAFDGAARAGCLVGFSSQCSINPFRYWLALSIRNHTFGVVSPRRSIVLGRSAVGSSNASATPISPSEMASDSANLRYGSLRSWQGSPCQAPSQQSSSHRSTFTTRIGHLTFEEALLRLHRHMTARKASFLPRRLNIRSLGSRRTKRFSCTARTATARARTSRVSSDPSRPSSSSRTPITTSSAEGTTSPHVDTVRAHRMSESESGVPGRQEPRKAEAEAKAVSGEMEMAESGGPRERGDRGEQAEQEEGT